MLRLYAEDLHYLGETEKEARCAAMLKTMGVDQT